MITHDAKIFLMCHWFLKIKIKVEQKQYKQYYNCIDVRSQMLLNNTTVSRTSAKRLCCQFYMCVDDLCTNIIIHPVICFPQLAQSACQTFVCAAVINGIYFFMDIRNGSARTMFRCIP